MIQLTDSREYDYIADVRYRKGGFIEVGEDTKVESIILSLDNSKSEIMLETKYSEKGKFSDSDSEVNDFLNAVTERIKKDGQAKLHIVGQTQETNLMDFNLQLNLDAYVVY